MYIKETWSGGGGGLTCTLCTLTTVSLNQLQVQWCEFPGRKPCNFGILCHDGSVKGLILNGCVRLFNTHID